MKTTTRTLELNTYKRIYNKEHCGEKFVCFEQDWKNSENFNMKSWINLDLDEWESLVKILWEIDEIMGVWITKVCSDCNDVRIPTQMVNRRLTGSKSGINSIIISSLKKYAAKRYKKPIQLLANKRIEYR